MGYTQSHGAFRARTDGDPLIGFGGGERESGLEVHPFRSEPRPPAAKLGERPSRLFGRPVGIQPPAGQRKHVSGRGEVVADALSHAVRRQDGGQGAEIVIREHVNDIRGPVRLGKPSPSGARQTAVPSQEHAQALGPARLTKTAQLVGEQTRHGVPFERFPSL